MVNPLNSAALDVLRAVPDAARLTSLPRCTSLYAQSQQADSVFLIEQGLVKLTRTNDAGGKIILAVCGPGQLVGEEALSEDEASYYTEAVTINVASLYRFPRVSIRSAIETSGSLGAALVSYVLDRKLDLAQKVELLCLQDVEYRILFYLAHLSSLLPPTSDGEGYQIPITQLELADLIGATRETTSTTLNQLERRGLLRLSRRLLTVPSPDSLRHAAHARVAAADGSANGATS